VYILNLHLKTDGGVKSLGDSEFFEVPNIGEAVEIGGDFFRIVDKVTMSNGIVNLIVERITNPLL